MTGTPAWRLDGFGERLDRWIELERPADDVINAAVTWTFTRFDNPFAGVSRASGFDNLWFGPVPGTLRGNQVVICLYWIKQRDAIVSCENYATLSTPL